VSTDGGEMPIWARSGEIFYHAGGGIYSVPVATRDSTLSVSKPVLLFRVGDETGLSAAFDVTPDGERFLMLRSRGRQHVSLILNLPQELAGIESAGASG
jgi:hypothetical protein